MENKIATSVTQSMKLREIGINVNTADMYWSHVVVGTMVIYEPRVITEMPHEPKNIPAWSLSALMNVLPAFIYSDNKQYDLYISKDFDDDGYFYSIKYLHELYGNLYTAFDKCFIDAVFKIIVDLKENKLI